MEITASPEQKQKPQSKSPYARCIEASKKIRWDIDEDVIRGRTFDFNKHFLPDGLSQVQDIEFLNPSERRLLSQIQGRTYAYIFGLVQRFINVKVLELTQLHAFGDQEALEALIRFCDEELKHQELFRRIEQMIGASMPSGYQTVADPNKLAEAVLAKSSWAVLGLICHIELFTQAHYRLSIAPDENLSELYKDVFKFHWQEESQHAQLDELEWRRLHQKLSAPEKEQGVNDLIELVVAVDGLLQAQAEADSHYFVDICDREFTDMEITEIHDQILAAYRWQYIGSGVEGKPFQSLLKELTTDEQLEKIQLALEPLLV